MELIIKIALFAPPVLLAITLHEVAHGWAARYLGDPTAASLGRLSLNPIKHIDPVGTVLVPGILLTMGGFFFGWAKPVPVNMLRLNDPKRDMALVALAGPSSNLLMAVVWALIFKFSAISSMENIMYMSCIGVYVNLLLMLLNLLPLPPLDGSKVLAGVLPANLSLYIYKLEKYGLFIFFGLILIDINLGLGILNTLVFKPALQLMRLLQNIIGLSGNELLLTLVKLSS